MLIARVESKYKSDIFAEVISVTHYKNQSYAEIILSNGDKINILYPCIIDVLNDNCNQISVIEIKGADN